MNKRVSENARTSIGERTNNPQATSGECLITAGRCVAQSCKLGPGFSGQAGFGLKFVKNVSRLHTKFFRKDGYFCRQLLLKKSS